MPAQKEDTRPGARFRIRHQTRTDYEALSQEQKDRRQYLHTIKTLCQKGEFAEAKAIATRFNLPYPPQYREELEACELTEPEPEPGKTPEINPDELKGEALDAALTAAGLPKTGTADEKRQRLKEALQQAG